MLSQITKAVKALKAAGNNKVRVIIYDAVPPVARYKHISWMVEFDIIQRDGYYSSILKSGKLAAHIVKNITPALKTAVHFEVQTLDNRDNRS
jgi:hypothetical protein